MRLDSTHNAILAALAGADEPMTSVDIAAACDRVSVGTLESKLRFLHRHGYVEREREEGGRRYLYTLADDPERGGAP